LKSVLSTCFECSIPEVDCILVTADIRSVDFTTVSWGASATRGGSSASQPSTGRTEFGATVEALGWNKLKVKTPPRVSISQYIIYIYVIIYICNYINTLGYITWKTYGVLSPFTT
jgi:hypothetical protein